MRTVIPHGGLGTDTGFVHAVPLTKFTSPSHTVGSELRMVNLAYVHHSLSVTIPHGGLGTIGM